MHRCKKSLYSGVYLSKNVLHPTETIYDHNVVSLYFDVSKNITKPKAQTLRFWCAKSILDAANRQVH